MTQLFPYVLQEEGEDDAGGDDDVAPSSGGGGVAPAAFKKLSADVAAIKKTQTEFQSNVKSQLDDILQLLTAVRGGQERRAAAAK